MALPFMHISIDTVQLYQYHHTHTLVGVVRKNKHS
jgi:hypothetical protein